MLKKNIAKKCPCSVPVSTRSMKSIKIEYQRDHWSGQIWNDLNTINASIRNVVTHHTFDNVVGGQVMITMQSIE